MPLFLLVPRLEARDSMGRLLSFSACRFSFAQHRHHNLHTHETARRAQNAPCKRLYSPDIKITPNQLYNANSTAEVSNAQSSTCIHPPLTPQQLLPHPASRLSIQKRSALCGNALCDMHVVAFIYPWLYSGRRSFRMGEMSGCSCARNVMAHMMYIAAAERTRVERQTLSVLSVCNFAFLLGMYVFMQGAGERSVARPCCRLRWKRGGDVRRGRRRRRDNVRLVLPLRREEPCCCAEDGRDHEADERCPAVPVSCVSLQGSQGRAHPFAIVPVLYVWIGEEASRGGAEAMR
jgi:hypothetical protein